MRGAVASPPREFALRIERTLMRLSPSRRNSWTALLAADASERRTQRLSIGGEVFEVHRVGRGEPLVLAPGLAGGWRLLKPLIRRLSRHYEVFACGLRGDRGAGGGLGVSARSHADVAGHAADLATLIDRLGLERPSLMGVSFGGAVALELAIERPRAVGALIVQGMEERFRTTLGSKILGRVLDNYPLPVDSPFINQFLNLLYAKKPEPGPQTDFVVSRIWETPQAVIARRLARLEQFDVADRLWRIDAPTLILAGSGDVIIPASRQKQLARGISGARFESVAGAGHIGFVTHPEQIAAQVREHLQRVKASV